MGLLVRRASRSHHWGEHQSLDFTLADGENRIKRTLLDRMNDNALQSHVPDFQDIHEQVMG